MMFLHVHRRRARIWRHVSTSTGDATNEMCDSSWSRGSREREDTRSSSHNADWIGIPPNQSRSNGWLAARSCSASASRTGS